MYIMFHVKCNAHRLFEPEDAIRFEPRNPLGTPIVVYYIELFVVMTIGK